MSELNNILKCYPVNDVDKNKVNEIVDAIKTNGWIGAPILYAGERLITGSHRQAALKMLEEFYSLDDIDLNNRIIKTLDSNEIGFDVSAIINNWFEITGNDWDDIDFSCGLRHIFAGTEIEQYKDYIEEW